MDFSLMLIAAAGGAFGTAARFTIFSLTTFPGGGTFPYGTIVVNLSGCFVMGLLSGIHRQFFPILAPGPMGAFFQAGFLGGYTALSALVFDFGTLLGRGEISFAFGYLLASYLFSPLAYFGGAKLVRMLFAL